MNQKEKSKKRLIDELVVMLQRIQSMEKSITELKNENKSLWESMKIYRVVADNSFNWEFWLNPAANDYIHPPPVKG